MDRKNIFLFKSIIKLIMILSVVLSGSPLSAKNIHVVDYSDSLSQIIWSKIQNQGIRLYGKNGLLLAVIKLNPQLINADKIRPGEMILLPDLNLFKVDVTSARTVATDQVVLAPAIVPAPALPLTAPIIAPIIAPAPTPLIPPELKKIEVENVNVEYPVHLSAGMSIMNATINFEDSLGNSAKLKSKPSEEISISVTQPMSPNFSIETFLNYQNLKFVAPTVGTLTQTSLPLLSYGMKGVLISASKQMYFFTVSSITQPLLQTAGLQTISVESISPLAIGFGTDQLLAKWGNRSAGVLLKGELALPTSQNNTSTKLNPNFRFETNFVSPLKNSNSLKTFFSFNLKAQDNSQDKQNQTDFSAGFIFSF